MLSTSLVHGATANSTAAVRRLVLFTGKKPGYGECHLKDVMSIGTCRLRTIQRSTFQSSKGRRKRSRTRTEVNDSHVKQRKYFAQPPGAFASGTWTNMSPT